MPGSARPARRESLAGRTDFSGRGLAVDPKVWGLVIRRAVPEYELGNLGLARIHRRTPMDGVRTAEGGG